MLLSIEKHELAPDNREQYSSNVNSAKVKRKWKKSKWLKK